ncbi:MAG: hypothetical protein V4726_01115 [Verrucomicrobiota bacterium]
MKKEFLKAGATGSALPDFYNFLRKIKNLHNKKSAILIRIFQFRNALSLPPRRRRASVHSGLNCWTNREALVSSRMAKMLIRTLNSSVGWPSIRVPGNGKLVIYIKNMCIFAIPGHGKQIGAETPKMGSGFRLRSSFSGLDAAGDRWALSDVPRGRALLSQKAEEK